MRGCSCNGCRKRHSTELKSPSSAEYGPKAVFTIDRINRLQRYFDLTPMTTVLGVDLHAALDVLDGAAKLLTRPENSQMRRSVTLSAGGHGAQWYVGARLARLEAKVSEGFVRPDGWDLASSPKPIGSDFWSDEDWRAREEYRDAKSALEPSGAFSFWLGEMG